MHHMTMSGRFRPGPLCLLLFFATFPSIAGEGAISLRCAWTSPNDRARLELSFSGNPMLFLLPGESLELCAEAPDGPCRVTLLKDGKPHIEDAALSFVSPDKPGSYYIPLMLSSATCRRMVEICIQVPMRATARKTDQGFDLKAGGMEIGHYRHPSRSGNAKVKENPDSYQPPVWWLAITQQNQDFEVVPGLTAAELVVSSEDTGTRHTDLVPVKYSMWLAIGTLRDALTARGIPGDALKIISAHRTPAYNRAVGSNAFGRHIFGDAFDFYIDAGNGKAMDLNRDGKLDRRDAYPVIAVIEDLMADGKIPMGGIGIYNYVAGDHVVTMHVDQRGHRATWGYLYNAAGRRSEFSWQSRRFADLDRRDEQAAAARAAKDGKKYVPPHREPLQ